MQNCNRAIGLYQASINRHLELLCLDASHAEAQAAADRHLAIDTAEEMRAAIAALSPGDWRLAEQLTSRLQAAQKRLV